MEQAQSLAAQILRRSVMPIEILAGISTSYRVSRLRRRTAADPATAILWPLQQGRKAKEEAKNDVRHGSDPRVTVVRNSHMMGRAEMTLRCGLVKSLIQ